MMGTTHALMGMLLGATSLAFFPEHVLIAALAGFVGGLFPDIDLAFNHRKTMHYPSFFSIAAVIFGAATLSSSSIAIVGGFYFFLSAAVHCWLDIFGGGLETRPWKPSSDKGIYLHVKKKWIAPKRWIRWDGAPEDFILTALLGAACLFFYKTQQLRVLILLTMATGAVYMILRKKIVDWAPEIFL